MTLPPEILHDVLASFDRIHLEQLSLICRQFRQLIRTSFPTFPHRMLKRFIMSKTEWQMGYKPHNSPVIKDKFFDKFYQILPYIQAPWVRSESTTVYIHPGDTSPTYEFLRYYLQMAHLWKGSYLCFLFDHFNQLNDHQIIDSLNQLLSLTNRIECSGLGLVMTHTSSQPFLLKPFKHSLQSYEKVTLKIFGARICPEDLVDYLHSPTIGDHWLGIFFYLTKQIEAEPGPYGLWEGFQLGQFISTLRKRFLNDVHACSYDFTALLFSDPQIEPFIVENATTNERLEMSVINKEDMLVSIGICIKRQSRMNGGVVRKRKLF